VFADRPKRLRFQTGAEGEISFIKNVLRILLLKSSDTYFPSVESFQIECEKYFLSREPPRRASMTTLEPNFSLEKGRQEHPLPFATARYNPAHPVFLKNANPQYPFHERDEIDILKDDFEVCTIDLAPIFFILYRNRWHKIFFHIHFDTTLVDM
jgi:hypothetical protein